MAQAHVRNVLGSTANGWINLAARDEILRRIRQDEDEQREGGRRGMTLNEAVEAKEIQTVSEWIQEQTDRCRRLEAKLAEVQRDLVSRDNDFAILSLQRSTMRNDLEDCEAKLSEAHKENEKLREVIAVLKGEEE